MTTYFKGTIFEYLLNELNGKVITVGDSENINQLSVKDSNGLQKNEIHEITGTVDSITPYYDGDILLFDFHFTNGYTVSSVNFANFTQDSKSQIKVFNPDNNFNYGSFYELRTSLSSGSNFDVIVPLILDSEPAEYYVVQNKFKKNDLVDKILQSHSDAEANDYVGVNSYSVKFVVDRFHNNDFFDGEIAPSVSLTSFTDTQSNPLSNSFIDTIYNSNNFTGNSFELSVSRNDWSDGNAVATFDVTLAGVPVGSSSVTKTIKVYFVDDVQSFSV
jgi:hypothetical protein